MGGATIPLEAIETNPGSTSVTAGTLGNKGLRVSPATAIDYVFEAYQYDANGTPVGNKVKFTYRYQQ